MSAVSSRNLTYQHACVLGARPGHHQTDDDQIIQRSSPHPPHLVFFFCFKPTTNQQIFHTGTRQYVRIHRSQISKNIILLLLLAKGSHLLIYVVVTTGVPAHSCHTYPTRHALALAFIPSRTNFCRLLFSLNNTQ